MIAFLENNMGTICVSAVLAVIVALVAVKLIKDKKKGKSSCGCNCARCALSCSHRKE